MFFKGEVLKIRFEKKSIDKDENENKVKNKNR